MKTTSITVYLFQSCFKPVFSTTAMKIEDVFYYSIIIKSDNTLPAIFHIFVEKYLFLLHKLPLSKNMLFNYFVFQENSIQPLPICSETILVVTMKIFPFIIAIKLKAGYNISDLIDKSPQVKEA